MRSVLLVILSFLASASVNAEARDSETGTRQQQRQWAQCITKADRGTARRIVLGEPEAMTKAFRKGFFFQQKCTVAGRNITFQGLSFLGPMAEFLLRDLSNRGEVKWDSTAEQMEVDAVSKVAQLKGDFNSANSVRAQRSYLGLCLLKRDPAAASALLRSEIESEAERQSIETLSPNIKTCTLQGFPATMTLDDLRGSIAIAIYRLQVERSERDDA